MWHKPLNLSPLFFTVPACLTMEAWESTHIIYDVKMLYIFFWGLATVAGSPGAILSFTSGAVSGS
jgi:hypothetical protein